MGGEFGGVSEKWFTSEGGVRGVCI